MSDLTFRVPIQCNTQNTISNMIKIHIVQVLQQVHSAHPIHSELSHFELRNRKNTLLQNMKTFLLVYAIHTVRIWGISEDFLNRSHVLPK